MAACGSALPDFIQQGELARLIPVVSETSKEGRATSALLAVFSSVDEFGKRMLRMVGAPSSKMARIQCLTEVVFKTGDGQKKYRPDGLIVVKLGSRTWTAIVEVKVGHSELKADQIEAYLDIAKRQRDKRGHHDLQPVRRASNTSSNHCGSS